MAGLFIKPQSIHTSENKLSAMNLQNSSQGVAIPIVYGTARVAGDLLWYGDFKAIPSTTTTSTGGKGGGKSKSTQTTYTYTTGLVIGLCEGPISGFGKAWKAKNVKTVAELGFTTFTGSYTQDPWTYLTTNHAADAYHYRGTAYVAHAALDLGQQNSLPNMAFEIKGLLFSEANSDVTPAAVINDLLPNALYGGEFPVERIDAGSVVDFDTYCAANGIRVSPAFTSQRSAAEIITELCMIGNAVPVWSEGVLKFIYYDD